MKASVDVLSRRGEKNGCRTVAVLGDMRELGDYSKNLHMEVGALVSAKKISHLVSFGKEAANISLGAINVGMRAENVSVIADTEAVEQAAATVRKLTRDGGAVLFKASRAVRLERVIEQLKSIIDKESL